MNKLNKSDAMKTFCYAVLLPQLTTFVIVAVLSIATKTIEDYNRVVSSLPMIIILSLVTELSFLLAVFLATKYKKGISIKQTFKLHFNFNFSQVLIAVILSIVCLYSFVNFSNLTNFVLQKIGYEVTDSLGFEISTIPNLLLAIVLFGITPAICEEMVFRGVIFNGLRRSNKSVVFSALMSGLCFALVHFSMQQFVYQFVLGVIFCLIMEYSGTLILPMIMHAFNNIFVLVVSFITYSEEVVEVVYQTALEYIMPFVMIAVGLVVIYYLIKLFKKVTVSQNSELSDTEIQEETNEQQILENYMYRKYMIYGMIIAIALWCLSVFSKFI